MSDLQERAAALADDIRATGRYTTARGELAVQALDLIEMARRELPAEEADAVRREILEVLRSE